MKNISYHLAVAVCVALLCVASCREEDWNEPLPVVGDAVEFGVDEDALFAAAPQLRNAPKLVGRAFAFLSGKDSVFLEVHEEPLTERFTAAELTPKTKGATYTSASLTSFYVDAFLDNSSADEFMHNQLVQKSGSEWTYSPKKYWPQDQREKINFFAYAFNQGDKSQLVDLNFVVDGSNKAGGSFRFALPAPSSDPNNQNDAEQTRDLIFAVASERTRQDGEVNFLFRHALSALRFKVGEIDEPVKLKSLQLTNIYTAGECSFVEDAGAPVFAWTPTGSKVNYTQQFLDFGNLASSQELTTNENNRVFMMVPQTLDSDAALVLSLDADGNEHGDYRPYENLTVKFSQLSLTSWDPHKQYTFTLNIPSEVEVAVTDKMEGNVKSEMNVQNTGLSSAYVRVAIVGVWVADQTVMISGKDEQVKTVVAKWDSKASGGDGVFNWGATKSDWIEGPDGNYYYKYVVPRGESASKLFESYTLEVAPPVVGARLELSIVAQSVVSTSFDLTTGANQSNWPPEVVKQFSSTTKP